MVMGANSGAGAGGGGMHSSRSNNPGEQWFYEIGPNGEQIKISRDQYIAKYG